jgi:hypothetical protein
MSNRSLLRHSREREAPLRHRSTYRAVGNCVRRRWSTAAASTTETLAIHRGGRFGSRA